MALGPYEFGGAGMRPLVGIDLVHVPRIARSVERTPGFVRRCFTAAEQEHCGSNAARLAGRWAAKEALLKALGMGIGSVSLLEIEVLALASGAPVLRLSGAAAQAAHDVGVGEWGVSISHDGQYATAMVVGITP